MLNNDAILGGCRLDACCNSFESELGTNHATLSDTRRRGSCKKLK
jgi:hypothetical protein